MLLNLMSRGGIDPTSLVKKSFRQFQSQRNLVCIWNCNQIPNMQPQPKLKRDLDYHQKWKKNAEIPNEKTIIEFFETKRQLENLKLEIRKITNQPIYTLTFLNPGLSKLSSFAFLGFCLFKSVLTL